MIEVWHVRDEFFGRQVPFDQKHYTHVAEVSGFDLDSAFERTNYIDREWQSNWGVTAVGQARQRARSTSVGDVMVKVDREKETREHWLVAGSGFEQLYFAVDPLLAYSDNTR